MTSTTLNPSGASALPDYAPVPPSALGPGLNEHGYHVGRVERNLFWVTDGTSLDTLLGEVIAWSEALAPLRQVTQAA